MGSLGSSSQASPAPASIYDGAPSVPQDCSSDARLLMALFDTMPECIKVVAADGRLLRMNPAGLQMIGAAEAGSVIGRQVADLVAPEHRALWIANHGRVCAGEKLSWEFDIIGLNGIRRQMESHAAPCPMPDGAIEMPVADFQGRPDGASKRSGNSGS